MARIPTASRWFCEIASEGSSHNRLTSAEKNEEALLLGYPPIGLVDQGGLRGCNNQGKPYILGLNPEALRPKKGKFTPSVSLAHSQNHVILVDVRRTDFQRIGFRAECFKSERPVQFFRSGLSCGNRQQDLLQRRVLLGIFQKCCDQSFPDTFSSLRGGHIDGVDPPLMFFFQPSLAHKSYGSDEFAVFK